MSGRMALAVDGDNITALVTVTKLKAPEGGVRRIAREIALDFADACFPPVHCRHIAGISNVLPDMISRKFDPNFRPDETMPLQQLAGISQTRLAPRTDAWYRT